MNTNTNKGKFHYDEDWIDVVDSYLNFDKYEAEFEDFWLEVEAYATEHCLPTRYVEEEFIVEGEFQAIPVQYMHDLDNPEDYPERQEQN